MLLDVELAQRLASHLVPVDMATALATVKLLRAVRELARAEALPAHAKRRVEAA